MSKLTNRVINIPSEVEISTTTSNNVKVKGPLGEQEIEIKGEVKILLDNDKNLSTKSENLALSGTYNSLILNAIKGVTVGFKEILEVRGVGYKVSLKGNELEFFLGKSHSDYVKVPEKLKVSVEGNKIIIFGINKQEVRLFAFNNLKVLRKPSIYKKNKGIYYLGEENFLKIKPGKSLRK